MQLPLMQYVGSTHGKRGTVKFCGQSLFRPRYGLVPLAPILRGRGLMFQLFLRRIWTRGIFMITLIENVDDANEKQAEGDDCVEVEKG